ncbi:MAG: helix-turn-helix domain-containing protein [Alphaproteobacteria bacterium]|nr:helix-turn-helix domain-containing protein [Alphaproteobacteria bacterium]
MATSRPNSGSKTNTAGPTFRVLLRYWRTTRNLSQLALAQEAEISTRHLSFLETGRSRPSRDMVERLAEALDVPPADGNVLLLAAGYAPTYSEDDSAAAEFEAHERMLEVILSQQGSVPALVIDEDWNVRMRNAAAARLFGAFRPYYRLPESVADNVLHILCHPDGLRQFMPNWTEYAEPFVREIGHEASMGGRLAAERLRDQLHCYPGIPVTTEAHDGAVQPLLRLERNETSLSFYTAFTTFVLPSARQPRHIKIEGLYPADPATAGIVERLAGRPAR